MRVFIEESLAYSKVNTSDRPFEKVDLNKIVTEVLGDLEIRIDETHGTIKTDALPSIECDALQLRQLFQNMIGNSLKYCKKGIPPVIQISNQSNNNKENEEVEITFQDNGIGFDTRHTDRIFKPFQRLHGKDSFEGTGMGLAICKKIADRHKGIISAYSEPGKGTTLKLRLPVRQT